MDYQDLIDLVGVDKVEVGHMPSFLVVTQGLGYTVHGENAVETIVKELSTKDWWLAYRHQRTQAEADKEKEEKAKADAAAKAAETSTAPKAETPA